MLSNRMAGSIVQTESRAGTRRLRIVVAVMMILMGPCGCSSLAYYSQSVAGQFEILNKRRPIADVIEDPLVTDRTKSALVFVTEVLSFARYRLLLPDNGSYRSFTALGRPYVVWNVFATPDLSLEPLHWCYPFAGCLSYRGYFDEQDARAYAREFERRGFDVFVGGVAAYSTLGWFKDPVLDTMTRRGNLELAKVIFHELAHQKIYIEDDTDFNEAFADAVALIGLQLWFSGRPGAEYETFLRDQQTEDRLITLMLDYKARLEKLYASDCDVAAKQYGKNALIAELRARYAELRRQNTEFEPYDSWMAQEINNARFAALATYREQVPGFLGLFEASGGNLELFYTRVGELAACEEAVRHARLRSGRPNGEC